MSDKEILEEIKKLKEYKKSEWSIEEIYQVDNAIIHLQEMLIENRINRAIEYMEHYIEVEDAPINERIKIEFEYVIDILRGEDNE